MLMYVLQQSNSEITFEKKDVNVLYWPCAKLRYMQVKNRSKTRVWNFMAAAADDDDDGHTAQTGMKKSNELLTQNGRQSIASPLKGNAGNWSPPCTLVQSEASDPWFAESAPQLFLLQSSEGLFSFLLHEFVPLTRSWTVAEARSLQEKRRDGAESRTCSHPDFHHASLKEKPAVLFCLQGLLWFYGALPMPPIPPPPIPCTGFPTPPPPASKLLHFFRNATRSLRPRRPLCSFFG